ncbi:MAG: sulfatase [Bacteroidetes bacterium]|nr:sulfatase [Bacteroidota bacterium]
MRILYLDLDTLRPDHLGCYGYHRNTSPNIDSIAEEGILFSNYYTSDAPCLPSRTALMSGTFGIHNGVINHGGTAADIRYEGQSRGFQDLLLRNSLPGYLNNELGLHTCFIGGFGARHSSWNFYAGFREIFDTGMGGQESAEHVTPHVLDWIERKAEEDDWYLHINYWDPHTPHRTPAEFGNPFKEDPIPEWLTQEKIDRDMKVPGPHTIQDISMYDDKTNPKFPRQVGHVRNLDEMKQLIDGYDCGIRYMDDHIGMLFRKLEEKGILDDLVIMISSDHGENFGELGMYAEHGTADHICNRIPMIIRWPGVCSKGFRDDGLHYNLDLLPTLAEITGKPVRKSWDGRSFAASVIHNADTGRDFLVLGQCTHGCQRSVRWKNWIYIRTWHDGYHGFEDEMLFNLNDDPHEQNNLMEEMPEIAETGKRLYAEWHLKMMETMPAGYTEDPMDIVLREVPFHCDYDMQKYAERLKSTGRGGTIDMIKMKHPEKFT